MSLYELRLSYKNVFERLTYIDPVFLFGKNVHNFVNIL